MDKSQVRVQLTSDKADSTTAAEMGATRDWRKALRSQPAYRIANRTIRTQTQFISMVALIGLFTLVFLYVYPGRTTGAGSTLRTSGYNYTYPLTRPVKTSSMYSFRIAIIADLDTASKSDKPNEWYSLYKTGYLSYSPVTHSVVASWDKGQPKRLTASYALKGRGMELSELVVFDGRLLTFDDRTGLVYEILGENVVPWVVLMDGDGKNSKGFKAEWATVKDEVLYVGSMGKEWTNPAGDFVNTNPQYVKAVSTKGQVEHMNWVNEYKRIREVLGIYWPGYMIHESGVWSNVHRKWFFLPRRCSQEKYNETTDELKGCSVLITADERVNNVKSIPLPNMKPSRGFSSFKFVPSTDDRIIVALRSEELEGKTATYITAFNIDGEILMPDQYIDDKKYEGLEFV